MLAAPIGVDGAVERQVRRLVARDHRLRPLRADFGHLGLGYLVVPVVIHRHRGGRREAVVRIAGGAPAAGWKGRAHVGRL